MFNAVKFTLNHYDINLILHHNSFVLTDLQSELSKAQVSLFNSQEQQSCKQKLIYQ